MLNLEKGQKIDLSKIAPSATKFRLGLGWDERKGSSLYEYDLDAFAVLCDENRNGLDMVYFNQKESKVKDFVKLDGDNLTGSKDGCDENIFVNVTKWDDRVKEILFGCNIYDCVKRRQNFGQIDKAFIELEANGDILAKFDLSEDGSNFTYYVLGRLYKHNESIKFEASGKGGNKSDLNQIYNDLKNL